jgi:cation diffusion facilitator CzcD-associated flavoprotein CzcO
MTLTSYAKDDLPNSSPGHGGETPHVRVAVVGAGFAGLGLAVALRREGITDFVILERRDDVGGTWYDNDYPGCACDVPSNLYSFSFAPNPSWSRSFSGQAEIENYLRDIVGRYRLRDHLRLSTEVLEGRWQERRQLWEIETNRGAMTADIVVSCAGALSDPQIPKLPGLADFRGPVFHSAQWRHDVDLTGKRVAVVGTGASAIQFIPKIQPNVAALHLFQRTPAWVMPRTDRPLTAVEETIYRKVPKAQQLARGGVFTMRESVWMPAFVYVPKLMPIGAWVARKHLERQVRDPQLRAKLSPDYQMGCKRVLLSNDYYPALTQRNVEVLTTGLSNMTERTVVGNDGTEREVDAVVFGTGFQIGDLPMAHRVIGSAGEKLSDVWTRHRTALRGTTMTGFPNLFLVIGPNTGLGHTSMIYIIESQIAYILDALKTMRDSQIGVMEPRAEAQERWTEKIDRRMARTVWMTGGCQSWYIDATGRNTTLWPGSTLAFRWATRKVDLSEYSVRPIAPSRVPATPRRQVISA